jgi:hypothetical protein
MDDSQTNKGNTELDRENQVNNVHQSFAQRAKTLVASCVRKV